VVPVKLLCREGCSPVDHRKIRRERNGAVLQDARGGLHRLTEAEWQAFCQAGTAAQSELLSRLPWLGEFVDGRGRLAVPVRELSGPLPEKCLSGPVRVYYEIEARCNLRCAYCGPRTGNAYCAKRSPHSAPEKTEDREAFLLSEIARAGAFQLQLTGGEFFIRGWKTLDTIERATGLGLSVILSTNGVWNHTRDVKEFVKRLASYGSIIQVKVSLDGDENHHDAFRGKGVYSSAVTTARLLSEAGIPVRLNAVLRRSNATREQLVHLCELAREMGATVFTVPLRPVGEAARRADLRKELLDSQTMSEYAKLVAELRQSGRYPPITCNFDIFDPASRILHLDPDRPPSCPAGLWGLHLTYEGDVYPCGFTLGTSSPKNFSCGRVREPGHLLRIWRESKVLQWWRYAGKSPQCRSCGHYGHRCWGGCPVNAWVWTKRLNGLDPLCPLRK
jgi:radical SAM protein with 4Fe4S-binding SPASM domain